MCGKLGKFVFRYLVFLLANSSLSWGGEHCTNSLEALKIKVSDFDEYLDKNNRQRQRLEQALSSCEAEFSTVSAQLATAAQSLTCQATNDASILDAKMQELAKTCQDTFNEIEALQVELRSAFGDVKADLDGGLDFAKHNAEYRNECGEAVSLAIKIGKSVDTLYSDITNVRVHAKDSYTDYGKFADTAKQLHDTTAAAAARCQGNDSTLVAALPGAPQGPLGGARSAPGVPKGESPPHASDITGKVTPDNLEAKLAAAKIHRPKAPEATKEGVTRTAVADASVAPALRDPKHRTGERSGLAGEGKSDGKLVAGVTNVLPSSDVSQPRDSGDSSIVFPQPVAPASVGLPVATAQRGIASLAATNGAGGSPAGSNGNPGKTGGATELPPAGFAASMALASKLEDPNAVSRVRGGLDPVPLSREAAEVEKVVSVPNEAGAPVSTVHAESLDAANVHVLGKLEEVSPVADALDSENLFTRVSRKYRSLSQAQKLRLNSASIQELTVQSLVLK